MDCESPESMRWRVYGERTLYDNPWVRLVKVDVEPPNGKRFEHHVVRLQRVAVAAVLDKKDRVLMLWRHRFVTDEWGWELPGGIVDVGEEALAAAARVANDKAAQALPPGKNDPELPYLTLDECHLTRWRGSSLARLGDREAVGYVQNGWLLRRNSAESEFEDRVVVECYDYAGHVAFNWYAPELQRRFTIALRRRLADTLGIRRSQLNNLLVPSFAKVAEFQRRGLVHFHALIRLDGPGDQ